MTLEERREKFFKEHPQHSLLRLTKSDMKRVEEAKRSRENTLSRLERWALIDKLRNIDGATLDSIGKRVGVTRQRVDQILAIIDGRNIKTKTRKL